MQGKLKTAKNSLKSTIFETQHFSFFEVFKKRRRFKMLGNRYEKSDAKSCSESLLQISPALSSKRLRQKI
jgi:hypothetical protein